MSEGRTLYLREGFDVQGQDFMSEGRTWCLRQDFMSRAGLCV